MGYDLCLRQYCKLYLFTNLSFQYCGRKSAVALEIIKHRTVIVTVPEQFPFNRVE